MMAYGKATVRTVAGVLTLLLAGCDGVKLCDRCQKPKPPPKVVELEVNWNGLGEAFKNIPTGGDRKTIAVEPVELTVTLQGEEGQKTVAVAGWDNLLTALGNSNGQPPSCIDCPVPNPSPEIRHNINHSTFEFRFAPPWFNADQRSLFTSYVVFPEEAKFEQWKHWTDDDGQSCAGNGAIAAACPDRAFHREVTGPFLKALARCATTQSKVTLHTVGFASSSGLDGAAVDTEWLSSHYNGHILDITGRCQGNLNGNGQTPSDQFNLIVANRRAHNVAEMLRGFPSSDAFDITATPWCSLADMMEQRHHTDQTDGAYDGAKGLMNRRVEIRLADLAGCLNVHPDKRVIPLASEAVSQ